MLKNKTQKHHRGAGFTLVELLVTLAIVGILLAVVIPAVFTMRKNMKMKELDACARTIFVAAQNRLTGMQSSGTLSELQGKGAVQQGTGLNYLSSALHGDAVQILLPTGAIDPAVAQNHYIIVYNPPTGTVREVYYGEQSFDPADAFAMGGASDENVKARKKAMIGYYDGEDLALKNIQQLPTPKLEVVNNDELKVMVDVSKGYVEGTVVSVVVEDLPGTGKQVVFSSTSTDPTKQISLDPVTKTGEVMLDSLDGTQFRSICPGITPGGQIKITASIAKPSEDDTIYLGAFTSRETNSLLAGQEGNAATVAYGRHLQNLDTKYSGISYEIEKITQEENIRWPKDEGYYFKPIVNTFLTEYDGHDCSIEDLAIDMEKTPLANSAGLFSTVTDCTLQNIRIVNPAIAGNTSQTGVLASYAEGTTISNCHVYIEDTDNLADHAVSGGQYVGGLIGQAKNVAVQYCSVGLPSLSAGKNVKSLGGLVGWLEGDCTITNSYACIDQLSGKADTAAMLIGSYAQMSVPTVSNCYAVGNISAEAPNIAGFLYGYPTKTTNSYCAVTYTDGDGAPRALQVDAFGWGYTPATCASLAVPASVTLKTPGDPQLTYDELATWNATQAYWTKLDAIQSHPYDQALLGAPSFGAYPFAGLLKPAAEGTAEQPVMHHYGSWPVPDEKLYLAYYEIDTNGNFDFEITDAGLERYKRMDDRSDDKIVRQDGYAFFSTSKITEPQVAYPYSAAETRSASCTLYMPDGKTPLQISIGTSPTQYFIYLLPYEAVQTPYATADFYQQITANGQTFWYSPHFAKGAVNSDQFPNAALQTVPVRSARQLAALGAHEAYWGLNTVTYLQELTIDYANYTNAYTGTMESPIVQAAIGSNDKPFGATYKSKQSCLIRNLTVPAALYYSGLFGTSQGTIQDMTIYPVGFAPSNADILYCGTLAGFSSGVIDNCKVVLEKNTQLFPSVPNFGVLAGLNYGIINSSAVIGGGSEISASSAAGFVHTNFDTGTISNCSVRPDMAATSNYSSMQITSGFDASGFVDTNAGTIDRCYAVATVSGNRSASGFVNANRPTYDLSQNPGPASIHNSYANCRTESATGRASGFVIQSSGLVESCYSLLRVQGGTAASGFLLEPTAGKTAAKNCYSAAEVTANTLTSIYGFAPADATTEKCFYLSSAQYAAGAGQALSYPQLSQLGGSLPGFVAPASGPGSTPFSNALQAGGYPFPMLPDLHHYGDWPTNEEAALPAGNDVLGVFYYQRQADGTYSIQTASLTCDTTDNKLAVTDVEPSFFSGAKTAANPPQPEAGMGLFWSKSFPIPEKKELAWSSEKKGYFHELSLQDDMQLDTNYYFIPLPSEVLEQDGDKIEIDLKYKHDNGNGYWEYEFEYDKKKQTFFIEKED